MQHGRAFGPVLLNLMEIVMSKILLIALLAPLGATSVSFNEQEYEVVDGKVSVPQEAVEALTGAHGYRPDNTAVPEEAVNTAPNANESNPESTGDAGATGDATNEANASAAASGFKLPWASPAK